jgi:hypothetical protein
MKLDGGTKTPKAVKTGQKSDFPGIKGLKEFMAKKIL